MSVKTNVTLTTEQLSLQAQNLHTEIDKCETETAAPLYYDLGCVLQKLQKQFGKGRWKAFLAHCDSLSLRRSRVTRALRVKERYKKKADCTGVRLYEALGHKKSSRRKSFATMPVEAPLAEHERKAVERLEKALGGAERLAQVLRMFFAERQPALVADDAQAAEPTNVDEPASEAEPATVTEPASVPEPVVAPKPVTVVKFAGTTKSQGHKARHALKVAPAPVTNKSK